MLTDKQKERYSRQIISSSIGEKGQEKLAKIKVLQIGAGGLGSPFALYITAAGIDELRIVDNDTVSLSNLQRQILFREDQIDKIKTDIAKKELEKLNSEVTIKAYQDYVDEVSIEKYVKDIDFIVDCSDNLKTKFLVNRTAVKHNIKCVVAGIKDFFGQIITVDPKSTACYECVFTEQERDEEKENPLPVIGATAGVLGTLEGVEVIKTALGLPNLYNKLLMVDLLNHSYNIIEVVKNKKCICSQ
ncbi:MAG: HesA/MoeB/ThiF family protein [Promethearchaeia archaeon]